MTADGLLPRLVVVAPPTPLPGLMVSPKLVMNVGDSWHLLRSTVGSRRDEPMLTT